MDRLPPHSTAAEAGVLDIDTQPSDEFKQKLGAWICHTLNAAQHNNDGLERLPGSGGGSQTKATNDK